MLVIRKEQLLAMGKAQEERFIRELVQYARDDFSEETNQLSDGDIDAIARQAISKSQGYGMTERADIYRYFNFMLIYGLKFDEDLPWAKEILNTSQERIGTIKMLELHEMAISLGN